MDNGMEHNEMKQIINYNLQSWLVFIIDEEAMRKRMEDVQL